MANDDDSGTGFIGFVIAAVIIFPIGVIWVIVKIVKAIIKYYDQQKFNENMDNLIGHNIQDAILVFGVPTGTFQEGNLKIYEWGSSMIRGSSSGSSYSPQFFNYGNERVHSGSSIFKTTSYIYSIATNEYGKILSWKHIVR
ncbi:hypothetical protein AGMMS49991_09480 [Spirochaetia bacterium]|nr:hypothetical protein AGMMS49991_09480 [Spirochaetia bacterium]